MPTTLRRHNSNHREATAAAALVGPQTTPPPPTARRRRVIRRRRVVPQWCHPSTVIVGAVLILVLGSVLIASWWLSERSGEGAGETESSKQQQAQPSSRTGVAVFYHIFIPDNKGKHGWIEAQRIVLEQVHQVAQAARASGRLWTLYYTTTGASNQTHVTHEWMQQVACGPGRHAQRHLQCVSTGPHLAVGYEDETLHALYEHCRRRNASSPQPQHPIDDDDDHRLVIYLHSKGTYHSNQGRNDLWRQALTHAATHPSCLASLLPHHHQNRSRCNVCGLQFYPLWTTFFPGNMFAASCAYVRQLWDPQAEFPVRLAQVVRHVNESSQWTHALYNFANPGNVGLERYASEHWIASHPSLRPCDVQSGNKTVVFSERVTKDVTTIPQQQTTTLSWWQFLLPFDTTPTSRRPFYRPPKRTVATAAPRVSIYEGDWFRLNQTKLQQLLQTDSSGGRREYFLLPGLLYRHYQLYRAYPPSDSWMWRWYPQGPEWWNRIYGPTNEKRGDAIIDW